MSARTSASAETSVRLELRGVQHDMPDKVFAEIAEPSIKIGNRKWYTLPLSIVVRTGGAIVLAIVPLMASDVLPETVATTPVVAPLGVAPEREIVASGPKETGVVEGSPVAGEGLGRCHHGGDHRSGRSRAGCPDSSLAVTARRCRGCGGEAVAVPSDTVEWRCRVRGDDGDREL